jgi:hypothetical protein
MTVEDHKKTMNDVFDKFNGEQVECNSKYGFYKFTFENKETAEKAFIEYNDLGGYSAREKNEITVFIKKKEDNMIDVLKSLDLKTYALRIAIFSYWAFALFSVALFCYLLPYNALAILIGIVIYSHFDCYLQ